MLVDYHVHPDFSADAKGSIADYCERALSIGVAEICFTPHYDGDSQRSDNWVRVQDRLVPMKSDWIETYLAAIEDARQRFPSLFIGAGLEVDYFPELEGELARLLSKYTLDFVLGSVHSLSHLSLALSTDCQVYFTGRTARQVCVSYFRVARLAVQSGLFDAIGHLDIFKRFGRRFYGADLTQAVYGLAEPVFDEIAKRDIALEVNSGGWRHDCHEPYPGVDLLSLAHDLGVRWITLGSDAHEVDHLGDGIRKGAMIAQEAGFDEFSTFRGRRRTSQPFAVLRSPASDWGGG